ncbi:MAG: HAMP domain-containing histidine kinase [Cyanobacteria bacterium SZAS LIN-3]|nr:HAMP domain-containing histidine kinase [Cyanobacteria bacterium SZAS LIN-3]
MRSRFAVKSKILVKGLAFILIPCAIDTASCIWLLHMVSETEEIATREHMHMEIVKHANCIMTLYSAASGQLGTYASTGDEASLKAGQDYQVKLNQEFDKLAPLIVTDPKIAANFAMYRHQGADMLKQLETMGMARNHSPEDMADILMRLRSRGLLHFISQAGTTTKKVTDLAISQEEELEQERIKQIQSREKIKVGLQLLIGFNLLLALVMGGLFLYDITRRLSILVQNAQLLPKLLPLNERVQGGDELSYLDEVLHDAASELRNASEQRRYLMEMVAHDIRSPLMSSQVSLEVLSDKRIGELPAMAKRQIDALTTNIRRVISLTSDLLEVDKLEGNSIEINPELIDICDVVEENLTGLAELAKKKNITLVNECPHVKLLADRLRIGQVLTNIVSNAIKFSPENQWIRVLATASDAYLTVSVIDNGTGIAKKNQQRIFEKYAQLENGAGKGFGLGLAISKLIIEAHDGGIGVTNEPGAGARFWFRLPLPRRGYDED